MTSKYRRGASQRSKLQHAAWFGKGWTRLDGGHGRSGKVGWVVPNRVFEVTKRWSVRRLWSRLIDLILRALDMYVLRRRSLTILKLAQDDEGKVSGRVVHSLGTPSTPSLVIGT